MMSKAAKKDNPKRKVSGQTLFLVAVVVGSCLMFGYFGLFRNRKANGDPQLTVSQLKLEDIPFNGARAYGYLEKVCEIGPRPSGSRGMQLQQQMLIRHFQQLGGKVHLQKFYYLHPQDGSKVPMANLIVQWHPEAQERILLCTHYDTLPFPMLDPVNPRGQFVGANDGGSGVALLMEFGNEMANLETDYGVDFLFLDGEEFIFQQTDRFFIGSEYFARKYASEKWSFRYRCGVLLDMIGDADLQIYQERNSMWWKDTRPLVEDIWATARGLGVREFIPMKKYEIRDDHIMLHNLGKIPTCNLIDFDYPSWHTEGDTVEKCSALSLAKVGWVLREWLESVAPPSGARRRY